MKWIVMEIFLSIMAYCGNYYMASVEKIEIDKRMN